MDSDIICFYSCKGELGCFSNFYVHKPFTYYFCPSLFGDLDSISVPFSELAIMACKAAFFGDWETYDRILVCSKPSHCKKLGRLVKNFDEYKWSDVREGIAFSILKAKFESSFSMRSILCNTKGKILAEASPTDRIWGIGLSISDGRSHNVSEWRGKNILGFTLMKVRDSISNKKSSRVS